MVYMGAPRLYTLNERVFLVDFSPLYSILLHECILCKRTTNVFQAGASNRGATKPLLKLIFFNQTKLMSEPSITKIPAYIPADNLDKYVSVADVYSAISSLEPFTAKEQNYIASILNQKRHHRVNDVKLNVYIEECGYATYVSTTIYDLKQFVQNLSEKLKYQTDCTVIPLCLDSDPEEGGGVLQFGLTYDSTINAVRNNVVDIIKNYIERERKQDIQNKLNAEKRQVASLKKKQREADILTLIIRLQNKEITPEEFKTLSEAL